MSETERNKRETRGREIGEWPGNGKSGAVSEKKNVRAKIELSIGNGWLFQFILPPCSKKTVCYAQRLQRLFKVAI